MLLILIFLIGNWISLLLFLFYKAKRSKSFIILAICHIFLSVIIYLIQFQPWFILFNSAIWLFTFLKLYYSRNLELKAQQRSNWNLRSLGFIHILLWFFIFQQKVAEAGWGQSLTPYKTWNLKAYNNIVIQMQAIPVLGGRFPKIFIVDQSNFLVQERTQIISNLAGAKSIKTNRIGKNQLSIEIEDMFGQTNTNTILLNE